MLPQFLFETSGNETERYLSRDYHQRTNEIGQDLKEIDHKWSFDEISLRFKNLRTLAQSLFLTSS
jgi:hypothetical protein